MAHTNEIRLAIYSDSRIGEVHLSFLPIPNFPFPKTQNFVPHLIENRYMLNQITHLLSH